MNPAKVHGTKKLIWSFAKSTKEDVLRDTEVWWDDRTFYVPEPIENAPNDMVAIQKPGHIRFIPKGTIVYVSETLKQFLDYGAKENDRLNPSYFSFKDEEKERFLFNDPIRLDGKFYIDKKVDLYKPFHDGHVVFDRVFTVRHVKTSFVGSYLQNGLQLRFWWFQCYVDLPTLELVAKNIENGYLRYAREFEYLRNL